MRDHLVTGISWINFPCEASFRWWLITTHGERKIVFQRHDGSLVSLPLTEQEAQDMLHLVGETINHPDLRTAQV